MSGRQGFPDMVWLRDALPADAPAVAALHADSWRRHYRGAYSDAFLDGDVEADRLEVWTDRLGHTDPSRHTLLAEAGDELVGFVNTFLEADPVHGALIDNLHVRVDRKRGGLGTTLLTRAAGAVARRSPGSAMHLWVLEQNTDAQAFYEARGGRCVETSIVPAPGGVASRLGPGTPRNRRYVWSRPTDVVVA